MQEIYQVNFLAKPIEVFVVVVDVVVVIPETIFLDIFLQRSHFFSVNFKNENDFKNEDDLKKIIPPPPT